METGDDVNHSGGFHSSGSVCHCMNHGIPGAQMKMEMQSVSGALFSLMDQLLDQETRNQRLLTLMTPMMLVETKTNANDLRTISCFGRLSAEAC